MNEHEFRELSAGRALHALSAEEEQEFSRALAAHPEWQAVVDQDRETAAALGDSVAEVAPPLAARAAVLDLISQTPQFDGGDGDEALAGRESAPDSALADRGTDERSTDDRAPRHRRRAGWFALAASVAILLAVSLVLPWGDMLAPKDPATIALEQVEAAPDAQEATAELPDGTTATLHWSTQAKQAVFVADGMQAAPSDRDYELWIVRGETPISLGVMRVDHDGAVQMITPGFEPGDAVAITVEDRGGSPSGLPTTAPIMVVATA